MSPNAAHNLVVAECQRANRHHGNYNRNNAALIPFRDASIAKTSYELHLLDVLDGLKRAVDCGFYNPESFDVPEYERREQVENGDSNWILPGKLMAFCGPHPRARIDASGFPFHSPESYFDYFRSSGVKAVIRLNMPTYEGRRFTSAGFTHYDLFFPDGTTPTANILDKFISICEKTDGAVAIHCKAGLGRTGTLIACYLMKHFRFTAPQAMGWIRVCRPGSVIGCQQNWLLERQTEMWRRGAEAEKLKREEEEKFKKKLIDGATTTTTTKRTTVKKELYMDQEDRATASSSGSLTSTGCLTSSGCLTSGSDSLLSSKCDSVLDVDVTRDCGDVNDDIDALFQGSKTTATTTTTTDVRRKTSVKGVERTDETAERAFRNELAMTSLDKQQSKFFGHVCIR